MDNKTISIVSYITLIGWAIAYFVGKNNADNFAKYHLKQGFGLVLVNVLFNVLVSVLVGITPALFPVSFIGIVFFILMIIGIINAANGVQKPLPFIGKIFKDKFAFIG